MSLIHWWPLTTDLNDKLSNISLDTPSQLFEDGKIGKALTLQSTEAFVPNPFIGLSDWSISFWVMNTGSSNWNDFLCFSGNRARIEVHNDNKSWTWFSDNTTSGAVFTSGTLISNSMTPFTWYHVTIVKNGTNAKFYLNSSCVLEQNVATNFTSDSAALYFNSRIGEQYANGRYNDIRCYNHALSKKEVKELSKALVLHYTFDNATIESTTNYSVPSQWSIHSPYWTLITNTPTGFKIKKTTGNTETTVAFSNATIYNTMAIGETWTASYYLYKNGQPYKTTTTAPTNYGIGLTVLKSEARDDGYFSSTFTITSKSSPYPLHVRIFGDTVSIDDEYEIRYVQFEKKDHATLYTPNTRSAILYNNVGLDVENNISTANTIYSPDAAIGSGALKCSNTSLRTPITGDITQGVTISCWIKGSIPTDSRVVFADHNSKLAFGFFNNGQAIITCSGYGHKCVTDIKTPWTSNWNHIVVRRDSTGVVKCFLNSNELNLSGSQEWTHSENIFSIGSRYSGGWTSYFNGLVDDVRVYHTTLSNTDIKQLYESRWAANRQGQVFSNAVNENQSKFQITRGGVNNCNKIYESGIVPSGYLALDGIKMERVPWINTGVIFNNANTQIIVAADVTPTATSGNNCLAGCGNSSWTGPVMLNFCGGRLEFGTNGYSTSSETQGAYAANERLVVHAVIDYNSQKWFKNGVQIKNITSRTCPTTTAPLYIGTFKTPSSSVGDSNSFRGYIHYFEVKYGSIHKKFIPCKRLEDSVLGMYEINEGIFYSPEGGTYTAGPQAVSQSRNGSLYCAEFNEI
jgi:hypothetical protein